MIKDMIGKLSSLDWDYYQNINSKSQFFCIKNLSNLQIQNKEQALFVWDQFHFKWNYRDACLYNR